MDISEYMFPVVERPVAPHDLENQSGFVNGNEFINQYKAIVREDTDEIISVVKQSYNLIPNETLISSLLDHLRRLGIISYIDEGHSFVNSHRMRLQVTFPGITIKDGDTEIAQCLFLSNSYDRTEPIRIAFGGVRFTCENGMVFREILAQHSARHTQGFRMDHYLEQGLRSAQENWPSVERRIMALASTPVKAELYDRIYRALGLSFTDMILAALPETHWQVYNEATWIVSHQIAKEKRADYQEALSRAFEL